MYFPSSLITTAQLQKEFENPNVVLLDCTIDKVGQSLKDTKLALIPNSLFFDIENIFSDYSSALPHTLVSTEVFTKGIQELGINQDSIIILYDRWGVYSSPRAWWMFKVMGFEQVYVLDGGLPAWKEKHHPIADQYLKTLAKGNGQARFNTAWYADKTYVLTQYENSKASIIDARSQARFTASAPEPRAGLRGGHIPQSYNLPFDHVLKGNRYRSTEELEDLFKTFDATHEQIFSCGSGVTASILAFASHLIGNQNIKVYDGSWSEWGQEDLDLPIAQ
ncbi:sulfurtransferase [Sphingobacterium faecium NBRC 15299]|uniref:sulfurtransferase n=1 Tax=Sphingobacterium faecium TaxID=34087 RepID=UPI000D338B99|nr:sulfurtransferase [Sphingobacterium faecium]PTX09018.1 thiosulfate/3-mercaptopyruvate sulfurtransferase [Sphingobacterium faecium]GEM65014.1 sulfurtransferase [Sphingobacterium faecium NBRC 15299]